ncbi:MAG: HlyD family secretion protein [Lachnospiraceae bacterium]|nr:HlyD family secretion protein [Lachnospiraceae bacterium]
MDKSGGAPKTVTKVLKKLKWVLLIAVVAAVIIFVNKYNAKKKADEELFKKISGIETSKVEKGSLINSIKATGTIKSSSIRTIASTIKDTKVQEVNVKVGDYVNEGDVLVTFTVDNINRQISDVQADISESKALQEIDSLANTRTYFYSYGTESITISDLQTKIERAQKNLNEACDGYGSLKRERQAKIDSGEMSEADAEAAYKDGIAAAYKAVEDCQMALDDAYKALETEVYKGSNTIADSTDTYNKGVIKSGDSTRTLERQLREYKENLDNYVVKAPISGLVTMLKVEQGNGFSGGEILTIQNIDDYFIETEIDEYDIPDIKEGQRVILKTDATRDTELEGVVISVAPTSTEAKSATGTSSGVSSGRVTYTVKIKITTADERIRLGMTARLSIVTEEKKDILYVPYNAIYKNEAGEDVIYIVSATDMKAYEDGLAARMNEGSAGIIDTMAENGIDIKNKKIDFSPPTDSKKDSELIDIRERKQEIKVSTGMESDYETEIIGPDLKEGMTVLLPETETEAGFDFSAFF